MRILEQAGFIKRYIADVDLDRITANVHIWATVSLVSTAKYPPRFERAIRDIEEIVEAFQISGPADYLPRFVCYDMKGYVELCNRPVERDLGIKPQSTDHAGALPVSAHFPV